MKRFYPYLYLAPSIMFLIFFVVYPGLHALNLSTFSYRLGKESAMQRVWLQNYLDILVNSRFWNSLGKTLLFGGSTVIVSLLAGFGLALLFWRTSIKGERLFRSLLLLPVMLTPVVVGLTWKWLFDPMFGLVNFALRLFGIHSGPVWLGQPVLAMTSVILVDVWQFTPFTFLVLLAGLKSLPLDLFDAARVDGASAWQTLWLVTIPLLRPIIIVVLLLRSFMAFRTFDTIFVLTRGGPGTATEVLNLYIYKVGFEFLRMGSASTLSIVIFLISLILSVLFLRAMPEPQE